MIYWSALGEHVTWETVPNPYVDSNDMIGASLNGVANATAVDDRVDANTPSAPKHRGALRHQVFDADSSIWLTWRLSQIVATGERVAAVNGLSCRDHRKQSYVTSTNDGPS
jgi:hypothetical protein